MLSARENATALADDNYLAEMLAARRHVLEKTPEALVQAAGVQAVPALGVPLADRAEPAASRSWWQAAAGCVLGLGGLWAMRQRKARDEESDSPSCEN
jgi:hypothetical protein